MSFLFTITFAAYGIIQAIHGKSIEAMIAMAICALFAIAGNIAALVTKLDKDSKESES